jgi:hypothetical protein
LVLRLRFRFVPDDYLFADASNVPGAHSREKAMNLLRLTGMACVPGEEFFRRERGENLLRFCFARKDADQELVSGWPVYGSRQARLSRVTIAIASLYRVLKDSKASAVLKASSG